jgi:hypothetical protein
VVKCVLTSAIKWGILATGGIAATFTENLKLLPDAEVVAVGSRSIESAQAFADRHDIPRAHGSWAELAADPDIELPHGFFHPDTFILYPTDGEPQTFHVPYEGTGLLHEAVEAMRCLREGLLESSLVPWQATLDVMGIMDEVRSQVGVRYPGE